MDVHTSLKIHFHLDFLFAEKEVTFFLPFPDSEGSFYLCKSLAGAQNSTFHWHGVQTSILQSKVGLEFYLCGNNVHYSLICDNKRMVKIGWYCPCQDVIFMLLVIMDIL